MGVKIGVSNIYMIQKSNKINAFCCFFIDFIDLLEIGQSFLTFVLYDIYILRERTLKTNSFLSLEKCKTKT